MPGRRGRTAHLGLPLARKLRLVSFLLDFYFGGFGTPRKYVFDVTSVGQRSSPWTCKLTESRYKFHLECKLHFPSAQLMLRQIHLTNVSESIEATYWVSWLRFDVRRAWIRAIKTALNSSFWSVTADSESGWPHGRKAYFRGVGYVWVGWQNVARFGASTPTRMNTRILWMDFTSNQAFAGSFIKQSGYAPLQWR